MAREEIPVNPNRSFDFIKKLPSELIEEFFCSLPKNLVWDVLNSSNQFLPEFNPPHISEPWYRRLEIERWLLSSVYVYRDFEPSLNWYNDELQRWLLLSKSQYGEIIHQCVEWPYGVVLFLGSRFVLLNHTRNRRRTIRADQYWLHPDKGGNVCAIGLPLRSNQHFSRLTLDSYTFDGSVSTNHRVDSLQLNGRHPHLDRVIDLSSVKQLSVLTPRRNGIKVFEYASKFTSLKDLFVYSPVAPEIIEAFSKTVTRLVWVMDYLNHDKIAEIAAKFSLLTYCEVTERVGYYNWPRIWLQPGGWPGGWRSARLLISMVLREFEKHQFAQLKTLVLLDYPLRVVRREGGWIATEDVETGQTITSLILRGS